MAHATHTLHTPYGEPEEGELSSEQERGGSSEDEEDGEILSSLDQRLLKNPLFNAFDPNRIPNNECATGMYP
jgi:hypothetical protein